MQNQKLEDVLNLSLEATRKEREKSRQLDVGYLEEEKRWELIVKYNGSLQPLSGDLIQVEELIAGYAIVTLPEFLIESFAELPEVEYIEKPKRLYFSVLAGKQTSCIPEVTVRDPFLSGKGVLMAILDSGIDYQSPEFQEKGGKTRIRYLWDQTLNPKEVDVLLTDHNEEFMQSFINNNYEYTEAISIDYAVLEKSKDIYVIPSNFGWDDVGSWEALDRYREKDEAGNVLVGSAKVVQSESNLVISSTQNIVVEGLSDIYVIENDGKILVGRKSNVKNVKELKEII